MRRGRGRADGAKGVVGDPNGRREAYVFGIDGDPTTRCYVLRVSRIGELELAPGGGRMATSAAGTTGPVEVNLAWPQDGQAADCLTEGETGKGLDPGEVRLILDNPAAYTSTSTTPSTPRGLSAGSCTPTPTEAGCPNEGRGTVRATTLRPASCDVG
jgi:hypothetical protein